jgi:CSLREA domain-containing protein
VKEPQEPERKNERGWNFPAPSYHDLDLVLSGKEGKTMTKTIDKAGKKGKERQAGLWVVSLIATIQIVGLVLFSLATPVPVEAKTFTVNSTEDETDAVPGDGVCESALGNGKCTLRAAIQEANWHDGRDTIKLNAGLYMLTIEGRAENECLTGDLDITQDLTIIGKGMNRTFINANKLDRVFHIRRELSVTLSDLTIQNGLATENGDGDTTRAYGGGIFNDASPWGLTLQRVTVSNNTAYVPGQYEQVSGGGIFNVHSNLTIIKSSLFNNAALGGMGIGGAIANHYGPRLTIKESKIYNNIVWAPSGGFGGAIFTGGAGTSLTIRLSTISNNTVSGAGICVGGGIANEGETLTITQSIISDNRVTGGSGDSLGGGFTVNGKATITGSTISRNVARGPRALGGAIRAWTGGIFDPELTVTESTLSDNAALAEVGEGLGGGVCIEDGTLTVQSTSRIFWNFSSDAGGGIFHGGAATVDISGSTVSKNIPDNIYPPP